MSIKNVTTPRDQMSTAFVYASSDRSLDWIKPNTSGAVNAGVPVRIRKTVSPSVARLLMPKSAILTHQSGPRHTTNMFCVARTLLVYGDEVKLE